MQADSSNKDGLTQRDLEWLEALANGADGKNLEGSSERGIRARLLRIRNRLGAKTTLQAVAIALRKGYIR